MFAKSTRATRIVAVLGLLVGLGWVWATLINPLLHPIAATEGSPARPFLIMMLLILALPGFVCVFFAVDLLHEVRIRSIKGTVGALAAAIVIWLMSALVGMLSTSQRELIFAVALLVGTLAALPAYAAVCKVLLQREGFVVPRPRQLLGKIAVLLVALQVWYLSSLLFTTYSPRQADDPDRLAMPWPIVGFLLPIVAAIAFYKFTNALLGNAPPKPTPIPEAR